MRQPGTRKPVAMRDPASIAQQQQARQQGLVMGFITLPLRFIGVLLGSLLLCLLIELVGLHLFWPEQGWRHAQGMMNFELQQLSSHFTRSVVVQEPAAAPISWWVGCTRPCCWTVGCLSG